MWVEREWQHPPVSSGRPDFLQMGLPAIEFNQKLCLHCDIATVTCKNHCWAEDDELRCYSCYLDQKQTYTVSVSLSKDQNEECLHFTARSCMSYRLMHSASYVDEVWGAELLNDLLITILAQTCGQRLMNDGRWRLFTDIVLQYRHGFPHSQWHAAGLRAFDDVVFLPGSNTPCRLSSAQACAATSEPPD